MFLCVFLKNENKKQKTKKQKKAGAVFMLITSQLVIDLGFELIEAFEFQLYNRILNGGIVLIFVICEFITWSYRKNTCCAYCKHHVRHDTEDQKKRNPMVCCYLFWRTIYRMIAQKLNQNECIRNHCWKCCVCIDKPGLWSSRLYIF